MHFLSAVLLVCDPVSAISALSGNVADCSVTLDQSIHNGGEDGESGSRDSHPVSPGLLLYSPLFV
jgi:hypothetical protein